MPLLKRADYHRDGGWGFLSVSVFRYIYSTVDLKEQSYDMNGFFLADFSTNIFLNIHYCSLYY